MRAANEAEDIIEYQSFEQIPNSSGGPRYVDPRLNSQKPIQKLRNVTDDIESMVEQATENKNTLQLAGSSSPPPISSSTIQFTNSSLPSKKDAMVGFDVDLMENHPSSRSSQSLFMKSPSWQFDKLP